MRSQWKVINNNYKSMDGYKRVAWPPVSEERVVREFTPQPTSSQHGAAVQQQYRASSFDSPQQNQKQYQVRQYQPNYPVNNYVNAAVSAYTHQQSQPEWVDYQRQQQQQQQQQQQHQQHQQQHQHQVQQQQHPVTVPSYEQQQQYSTQQQPAYNNHYAQRPQQEYDSYPFNPYNNLQPQYQAQDNHVQDNQAPYNSYSQFQQKHQQPRNVALSQDQLDQAHQAQSTPYDYRGDSPGIIQLRKEVPVTQIPAPVYNSQPAAVSFQGGSNMRGDMKWPPMEYKEAAAKENEERRKLALGPVCRPRKVKRDYSSFFAKNAINNYYPSYKVPPGTQHMLA